MNIYITKIFKKAAKKLYINQVDVLETVIEKIKDNPVIGELGIGNLSNTRIYKAHILDQLGCLAYTYEDQEEKLILLSFTMQQLP